ncbi:MAG: 3-oxo-tetronate 4-phosphate decarboxylase [Burkholderiaceae bacterium]
MTAVNSHADENRLRESICEIGRSLFERGFTHGSTGNISARCGNHLIVTPTGSRLGRLDPAALSKLDTQGKLISGDKPTKESFLHLAMYQERAQNQAVVHLHSTYSTAVSILQDVDPTDVLPPMTAYYVMRIGSLPLVPYYPPGDSALADAVRAYAGKHHAVLLANHGPVVGGSSLDAASDAVEELEKTAQLYLLLQGQKCRCLTDEQAAAIKTP